MAMDQAVLPFFEAAPEQAEETLDTVIAAIWNELGRHRAASCPVCGGEMEPDYGAHALPIGGRCHRCGAELR